MDNPNVDIGAGIKELLEEVRTGYNTALNNYIKERCMDLEQDILDMNRKQLETLGIKCDGKPLTPKYAKSTIQKKKHSIGARSQITGHVTLMDYGNFYRGMFIEYKDRSLRISSNAPYTKELVNRYGEDIFGLTVLNVKRLADMIFGSF